MHRAYTLKEECKFDAHDVVFVYDHPTIAAALVWFIYYLKQSPVETWNSGSAGGRHLFEYLLLGL